LEEKKEEERRRKFGMCIFYVLSSKKFTFYFKVGIA
jgi:hypothetical protein